MTATLRASCLALVLAAAAAIAAPPIGAQDALAAAKELYASAAYDEALSALDRLKPGAPARASIEIDQYRAFCLFALGRTGEAEAVAESVVRADPLVELYAADTSPRIVALFADLQKRLLPGLVRERYRSARATMEGADPAAAQAEFALVQRLVLRAKALGAWDEALADISVLVDGFLELNRSAAERRASAKPVEPPPPAPGASGTGAGGVVLDAQVGRADARRPSADLAAAPSTSTVAAPTRPAIYSALDAHVSAPVALQQQIPRVPANLALSMRASKKTGILEVTIDERGRVETALIRESVNPVFDGMVLAAARAWQYQPARLEGAAVRYVKRIAIALQ